MSAADDVAGLPGGGEVADVARKVENAQPQSIRDIATHWRGAASKCDGQGKSVTSAVNALDGAWAGGSADAFTGYMGNFTKAGTSMSEALNNGAAALESAAGALEQAKSAVDSRCEGLLVEVRKWDAAHPQPQPGERDAAIKPLCDAAKGDVQKSVDTANNELSNALNQLKGATNIGTKFSTLPAPGDQSFTPAPGRGIDWQAKPDPGPANTGTQSANQPAAQHHESGGGGGGGGGLGPSGGPPAGGGGPAPQGQVKEWIDEAIKILQENGVDTSKMSENDIWAIIQHESGGNPHAINMWDCVPLDTMILTRRGWLKHDEVRVGDETIGYDPDAARGVWTGITRIVRHADVPLVRIGNSRWWATTTSNHRWLTVPRTTIRRADLPTVCPECGWRSRSQAHAANGVSVHRRKIHGVLPPKQRHGYATECQFVETGDIRNRDRLLLSAPALTDSRLDISVREAAILGWIAGDGHVETRRYGPSMSIAQSKPAMVAKLTLLLTGLPHAVYIDDRGGCGPRHQFRLDHRYARDLLQRGGHPKADAVEQVLAMSTEQRAAWLEALTDAEGSTVMRPGYRRPQVAIYQSPGAVLDAAVVATYLSGARPRVLRTRRAVVNERWRPEAQVRANIPVVTGAFLEREDVGRGDVWCVTTELGTWTAREDEHLFLTGNSNAKAGHPSKGLMQCIDSTFQANKLPGHDDIYNPVDNIIAGVRYSIARYGSVSNVPGIRSMSHGGAYQGY